MTTDTATATACPSGPPMRCSNTWARAGSPRAPMAIEAAVIPTWQAAM